MLDEQGPCWTFLWSTLTVREATDSDPLVPLRRPRGHRMILRLWVRSDSPLETTWMFPSLPIAESSWEEGEEVHVTKTRFCCL